VSHTPAAPLTLTREQARHLVAVLDAVDDFFYHARHRPPVATALRRYAAACLVGEPEQAAAGLLADVTAAADALRAGLGVHPTTLRALFGARTHHQQEQTP
jgi:hypothetical protein